MGFGNISYGRTWKPAAASRCLTSPKGRAFPVKHKHASNQFMYCIEGEYEYTGSNLVLRPGSFYMAPKDHRTARRRRANAIS